LNSIENHCRAKEVKRFEDGSAGKISGKAGRNIGSEIGEQEV